VAKHVGRHPSAQPGVAPGLDQPRSHRRGGQGIAARVEEEVMVLDAELGARLEVRDREPVDPVVGEEDLALAATLADDAHAAARQIDVLAPDADDLVHAHARGHHQGHSEQSR
jgi:hypothetical protein